MGGEDVERRSRTGWREFAVTFRLAGWCEVRAGLGCKRMERVRGEGEANVIYRHVIGSLVRKPGAFARYRFREQLFPTIALPPRLRRAQGVAWGTGRRRVREDPAPGGDHHGNGSHGGQRTVVAAGSGTDLRLHGGAGSGRAQGARGAAADRTHGAGPESQRPTTHGQSRSGRGVRMTVVDTSIMLDRIGQLCGQFKLPTVGTQVGGSFPPRWPRRRPPHVAEGAGTGGWDRRHRRINRLRRETRLPSGKTWETPVFTGAGSSSMTGCPWRSGSNRTDSAGRTCARCSGGCSSGEAS